MAETDWREILSFSQKDLARADKEKLCESLSWMEADDIELNFSDLKSLFRLAQDILKFKSEQVNNLLGQLETAQRKGGKGKTKLSYLDSPTRSSDSALETIAHQEEEIKANKEILEQLYSDIARLEGRRNKLEKDNNNLDKDSESSRDALSEIDAVAQLEHEITMKNRHIRKLLGDVKILEDENSKLKEKVAILKEKLNEATGLIENLTGQLCSINDENKKLKDIIDKTEHAKADLSIQMESLKKQLFEKESKRENIYEEIKAKVQHWKNVAKVKKAEIETLSNENTKLKEGLIRASQSQPCSPSKITKQELKEKNKMKELQEKLSEAANEIIQSANIIEMLKEENKQLKSSLEESGDFSISDIKNESDDGKERSLILKLRKKVKNLTTVLRGAEEMLALREKELAEITSQLHLVKSDEGIKALLEGLKNKTRKLKLRDEGIKSLVQEVNSLNEIIDELQLENEAMRLKLNIPINEKVTKTGIVQKYRQIEQTNALLTKDLNKMENKLVSSELQIRDFEVVLKKFTSKLISLGCTQDAIDEMQKEIDSDDDVMDRREETSTLKTNSKNIKGCPENISFKGDIQAVFEENEGLRKGLQEILNFLKDNSTTTSGILALQCPSLETVLHSLDARHAAGWFAPHMTAVMELKSALGGKDALLSALHDARKETFDVMYKLSKETEKSRELGRKLKDIEAKVEPCIQQSTNDAEIRSVEFGTWICDKDQNIVDFFDKNKIEDVIRKGNVMYQEQLKSGLMYFHNKFQALFEKMTSIAIQTTDNESKWSLQEEKYKAEIENLKTQLQQTEDEDVSELSPGVINVPSTDCLQRKCSYLEESYKYMRTLNENLKNEYLESKRVAMLAAIDHETEIQNMVLTITQLTDKLRDSISLDLFWNQNETLNNLNLKYRKMLERQSNEQFNSTKLMNRLENDKSHILSSFQSYLLQKNAEDDDAIKKMMSNIEQSVISKQLEQICTELNDKNKEIGQLHDKIIDLQASQSKLIDDTLASSTKEDVKLLKDQLKRLADEKKILRDQCQHVESQLEIALLQLQDSQQRQMSNDMEVNMLRHQILDLQSIGDNKAIVARLSGEVLVAHLQASESHKKIERLQDSLNKEKQHRIEAEEMLKARQKIFDVYAFRYEAKFRYIYETMQVFRHLYEGSLPQVSIENYLNNAEDLLRKTHDVNEKLDEVENLQYSLITKHSVFDQLLDVSKNRCLDLEDSCQHKLQNVVLQGVHSRELDIYKKKINVLEQSRDELLKRCNYFEKTLVLVNQGVAKSFKEDKFNIRKSSLGEAVDIDVKVLDVPSDDESNSTGNRTVTLPKPQILNPLKYNVDMTTLDKKDNIFLSSPVKLPKEKPKLNFSDVFVQTCNLEIKKVNQFIQTDENYDCDELKIQIQKLKISIDKKNRELREAMKIAQQRTEENLACDSERIQLQAKLQNSQESIYQNERLNNHLSATIEDLRKQIDDYKTIHYSENSRTAAVQMEDNKSLVSVLKQFEANKNKIVAEFSELLRKEREDYADSVRTLQGKIMDLQAQLDRRPNDNVSSNTDALQELTGKYTVKIAELENKCFNLQSELDGNKTELTMYQGEVDRWKDLALERLTKMEQLNSKLTERHSHEVESYKAENEHWLAQLNDTQKEHIELRSRLMEQKAGYVKQLADKDAQIEQLRSVVHSLKTQIMNMQTMMSVADPSFDLSAIVEVEENTDSLSQQGSERLEIKYDSSVDLRDTHDDLRASSSSVWQEPVIERLRREKQLTGKQNAMLRRQIKALAARERRARLDAQNLKNQVFRISTSGTKVATAETTALHGKIASLQAQLISARRDTSSTVAIWDKWKRAQQAADRWQMRFEEKCREVKKLESSAALAKSAVARLEKEKRVLLQRLAEVKNEKILGLEKHDTERSEKPRTLPPVCDELYSNMNESPPPVSSRALLDRVQAQQRRIAALEVAEKGNEHLVSEYEKALAEITSLKGQVLKLESTLLESQIRSPIKANENKDEHSELGYWKSYCEMLKEENVQLNLKVSSLETVPTTAHQHRVNDLEQTVLTLRGLVSKLQSEQKSSGVFKRSDSRPNSSRSGTEKNRTQLESHRIEIANLKRSLLDKDLLLERSKEMLKIAAEREDDLLRENSSLRRQLDELTRSKHGFLSA